MGAKSSQLQIRVTPAQKAALKRLAAAAGQSVSGYVLSRALPSGEQRLTRLYDRLTETGIDHGATLRELAGVLAETSGPDLVEQVPEPPSAALGGVLANSVAALVETAAHAKNATPPDWTLRIPPLPQPHFGWPLRSLGPHQLRVAPIAFKRRNLFFDPATGPAP